MGLLTQKGVSSVLSRMRQENKISNYVGQPSSVCNNVTLFIALVYSLKQFWKCLNSKQFSKYVVFHLTGRECRSNVQCVKIFKDSNLFLITINSSVVVVKQYKRVVYTDCCRFLSHKISNIKLLCPFKEFESRQFNLKCYSTCEMVSI